MPPATVGWLHRGRCTGVDIEDQVVTINRTLRRGLVMAAATGALIIIGTGTAAAMPPPWSYQGTYNSYGECVQAAANLDERYELENWVCNIDAADTPERNLWVIW